MDDPFTQFFQVFNEAHAGQFGTSEGRASTLDEIIHESEPRSKYDFTSDGLHGDPARNSIRTSYRVNLPFARLPGERLGTHQRVSLRSLAFILCSAIRRARALSCAALPLSPDRNSGRKPRIIAKNVPARMAMAVVCMCSLLRT